MAAPSPVVSPSSPSPLQLLLPIPSPEGRAEQPTELRELTPAGSGEPGNVSDMQWGWRGLAIAWTGVGVGATWHDVV